MLMIQDVEDVISDLGYFVIKVIVEAPCIDDDTKWTSLDIGNRHIGLKEKNNVIRQKGVKRADLWGRRNQPEDSRTSERYDVGCIKNKSDN